MYDRFYIIWSKSPSLFINKADTYINVPYLSCWIKIWLRFQQRHSCNVLLKGGKLRLSFQWEWNGVICKKLMSSQFYGMERVDMNPDKVCWKWSTADSQPWRKPTSGATNFQSLELYVSFFQVAGWLEWKSIFTLGVVSQNPSILQQKRKSR